MKLEDTPADLRTFGNWLFEFIKSLGGRDGSAPGFQEGSGWYRAPATGKVCLYIYFAGKSRKSKHPNTAHLATLWGDELKAIPGVEVGNNYFGSPSADLYLSPDDPQAMTNAARFIRRAFKVVAVDVFLRSQQQRPVAAMSQTPPPLPVGREELARQIETITDDRPEATVAATWLKAKLKDAGAVTAG